MNVRAEIESLRRHLDELARRTDGELAERYAIRPAPLPPGLYWKSRWMAARFVRCLESLGIKRAHPWPPGLKHSTNNLHAKPLLVWALGVDREVLRDACREISILQESLPGFAPVLVTDVADFAFFSRLGWLVEYVPRLSGVGNPYQERKAEFLARLYRGAPALPVRDGLEITPQAEEIRRWLEN